MRFLFSDAPTAVRVGEAVLTPVYGEKEMGLESGIRIRLIT